MNQQRRRSTLVATAAALGLATAMAPAQGDPRLTVLGGSFPGTVQNEMTLGSVTGLQGALLFDTTPGPTPLAWIDPRDPRSLDVGLAYFVVLPGTFVNGRMALPTLPVPDDPSLRDVPLFFQGITFPGVATLIGGISEPRVVRFAAAGTFRDRGTQLSMPRAFFPIVPLGRVWLVVGGGSGGLLSQIATDTTERYDPLTDGFSAGPTMTTPRSLHTATRLPDGRWLIAAGVDRVNDPQNTAETLDAAGTSFTATGTMVDKRMGHSATLLSNGKVLVAGGLNDMNMPTSPIDPILSALDTTELYDPQTNTWSAGPRMRVPRAGHAAILLPDGRVLLAGGLGWTRLIIKIPAIFRDCDLYDPATNTIAAGPSLGTGRTIFPVTELGGGRWLVSGGLSTISLTQYGTPTDTAEIYDANANAWTPAAGRMAQARGLHASFPLGGARHLLIGGADNNVIQPNALDTTEVYDDATRTFRAGPRLATTRGGFGFLVCPTGQGHVLGGGSGPTSTVVGSTEWAYR
jgi:hypothetical protein